MSTVSYAVDHNVSYSKVQSRNNNMIQGIEKHLSGESEIALAGETYTPKRLIMLIQSQTDSIADVAATKAAHVDAVKSNRAVSAKVTKTVRGLRNYVLNKFGEQSGPLADFGFAPPKAATRTSEEKALAAKKGKATRDARGTKGKQQKKGIKGVLPDASAASPQSTASGASSPPTANGGSTPSHNP
jgi:hypothetical protein